MTIFNNYEVWFVIGSQHLYGPEALRQVTQHAEQGSALKMLEAKDLLCEREGRILFSRLSFSVAAGEWVQVTGDNGAAVGEVELMAVCLIHQADSDFRLFLELRDHRIQPFLKLCLFRQTGVIFTRQL
jgi:ABC-type molybdenum transport system ATPase subunit/photorepair protein PhrA